MCTIALIGPLWGKKQCERVALSFINKCVVLLGQVESTKLLSLAHIAEAYYLWRKLRALTETRERISCTLLGERKGQDI